MKKARLVQEFEEAGIIERNASVGAKHSKLKGLLNSISITGPDNTLVILTTQGENTSKKFGE